jgi:hypothetical protein
MKPIRFVVLVFFAFGSVQALPFYAQTTTDPANLPQRDGSHDFDFLIGDWKAHVRRLPDRLNNSNTWVEYNGISNHKKLLDSNANFEEFDVASTDKEAAHQGADSSALQSRFPSVEYLSRRPR